MDKHSRFIFLSFAIIFMLSLFNLIEKGAFIYPFQLNEPILFIFSIQIWVHTKEMRASNGTLFLFAFFQLLSSPILYELFLDYHTLESIFNSSLLDVFKILAFLAISSFFIIHYFKNQNKFFLFFSILTPFVILITDYFHFPLFQSIFWITSGYQLIKMEKYKNQGRFFLLLSLLQLWRTVLFYFYS